MGSILKYSAIPEQTPNIEGGEYIDVKAPKGEVLYEIGKSDNFVNFGELDFGWIQYYVNTTDGDYVTIDYNNYVTQPSEIITYRLPTEYEEKLIPIYDADKNPIIANNIITDELYSLIAPQMGFEVETLTDEQKEEIKSVIIPNVDFQEPLYAIKCYKDESGLAPVLTEDFIGVFVKTQSGEYGLITHLFGNITPINTIELESESSALIVDLNEKALEMIENAGSDITTNGWNIFDHKFSDHLLNDPSWVRSDTFSWQDGGIYFTAYEELEKEFNNAYLGEEKEQEVHYYAFQETNGQHADIYFKSPTPSEGDLMYIFVPPLTEYNSLIVKSYDAETQTVAVYRNWDEEQILTYFVRANEVYDEVVTETVIETKEPLTDTIGDVTITYYKSENGLKICLQDQSDAIEQLYANTGVAWYYIIDSENKRFKLPRSKWNFVGLRGNVGDYVDESLPNITGVLQVGTGNPIIMATVSGAFTPDASGTCGQHGTTTTSGTYRTKFDANKSSSTYQDNAPVQQRATEMYLYFFMGDTLRDARIIDVNAVVETHTAINSELDALKNLLANIDYVVESKVATEEDPTWYRVYKSGWIEQGGYIANSTNEYVITFNKAFVNTNYMIMGQVEGTNSNNLGTKAKIISESSAQIYNTATSNIWWEAKGQGA